MRLSDTMSMKIKQLARQIAVERIYEDKEINERINKSDLIKTESDRIIFLKEYAEQYPYPGKYINNELLKCATPTKEFSDFIVWLVKKDQYILDRDSLGQIYNHDKEIFEFLFKELSKSKEDTISAKLGLILGGMGQADPKRLFRLIMQKKIVETVLIGAIWETSFYHKIPDKILSIVLDYTNSNRDYLTYNAINLLINRFHKNPKILKKIIRLAKTDDKTKGWIAQLSGGISRENPHGAFLLLQQCAKTDDKNLILNNISMYVGFIATDYPMECLVILKNWVRKFDDVTLGQNIDWIAEQIGKSQNSDFDKIEEFLLKWINAVSNRNKWKERIPYVILEFSLPHLIHQIYKTNIPVLFSLLKKINYTQRNKKDVIVRIIETFFSNSYNQISKQLNTNCHDLLEKIAIHYNFDMTIEKNLPNPTMQTLALVQNIRLNKKSIDPISTKRNLMQFPNIVKFLTKNKLHKLIDVKRNHPFVLLLSRSKVTKKTIKQIAKKIEETNDNDYKDRLMQVLVRKYHSQVILDDLDQTLVNIKPEGTKEIRSLLLNEGFFEVLMQLNVYSRFKKKYHVTLEPKLKQKKVDLLVKIENNEYYFEIYQPKSPQQQELDYIRTAHSIDTGKLKSKIIEKFEAQLADTIHLNSPVILMIDDQHLSTTDIEIRDLLEGTLQFVIPINNAGPRTKPTPYATRANDSFNKKVKNGNLISAAILLRRDINNENLTVRLQGKIYENPGAKFPIDEKILKKIENSLFNTEV